MKIKIEKNIVDFQPENVNEKVQLEVLWKLLIDCVNKSGKLAPIGEYVPAKNKTSASFHIEGLETEKQEYAIIRVEQDCTCYCATCNRLMDLKKGDQIPVCCGKLMEIVE